MSWRTPNGKDRYSYGTVHVQFPKAVLASDGSTVIYRVIVQPPNATPGAEPLGAANCRIPNSRAAIDAMNHYVANLDSRSPVAGLRAAAGALGTSTSPNDPVFIDDKRRPAAAAIADGMVASEDLGTGQLPPVIIIGNPDGPGNGDGGGWGGCGDSACRDGGGSTYDPNTPPDITPAPEDGSDYTAVRPTCPAAASAVDNTDKAYCRSVPAAGSDSTKIAAALARMMAKGGQCAVLAGIGTTPLQRGDIRMYAGEPTDNFGGFAPRGEGTTSEAYVALATLWTTSYPDATSTTSIGVGGKEPQHRDLQQVLAHELDHLNGERHIGELSEPQQIDPYNTPNSNACSDITNFYN